jgi:L-rhamnose mutarotase
MTSKEAGRQRVCFMLQVKPDRLDEYRRRHAAVWPDMIAQLLFISCATRRVDRLS